MGKQEEEDKWKSFDKNEDIFKENQEFEEVLVQAKSIDNVTSEVKKTNSKPRSVKPANSNGSETYIVNKSRQNRESFEEIIPTTLTYLLKDLETTDDTMKGEAPSKRSLIKSERSSKSTKHSEEHMDRDSKEDLKRLKKNFK